MASYFMELLEKMNKEHPELAETIEIFKQSEILYNEVQEAMEYMNPVEYNEAVVNSARWDNNVSCVSISTK